MTKLLLKECKLAMHPTAPLFLLLSAMLMIPNYPYYVTFFYTGLAIFFTCLNGRENNDIFFTMLLPVRKRDIVKSRFEFVVILEFLQLNLAIPFAILRQSYAMPGNQVGMDANIALFGLSLIMLGIFNRIFFGIYYKDVKKVGAAFAVSSSVMFLYIAAAEVCDHVVPFFRDYLDTKDDVYVPYKLIVLAFGIFLFILLTALAYKKSVKNFEALDL